MGIKNSLWINDYDVSNYVTSFPSPDDRVCVLADVQCFTKVVMLCYTEIIIKSIFCSISSTTNKIACDYLVHIKLYFLSVEYCAYYCSTDNSTFPQ